MKCDIIINMLKIFKKGKSFTLIEYERSKSMRRNEGFTLIELLVVTVIITILTAAILLNYKNTGQQFALQRSAHKLAQDIRRAGEMAMSAQECCGGIVPPGYGIWLEEGNSNYILYADTQPPASPGNPTGGNEFYVPADDIIETIELEEGVVIQDINTSNKKVCINFKPPTPTIKIKFQDSDEINQAIITLASGGNTKTVKVNAVGLVEVE